MHFKLLIAAAIAGVVMLAPTAAEASCCDQKGHAAQHGQRDCCDAACCKDQKVEPSAVEMLLEMDPQLNPAPPVRQRTEVWFQRPVLVGRAILQGRHVIDTTTIAWLVGNPARIFMRTTTA